MQVGWEMVRRMKDSETTGWKQVNKAVLINLSRK